MSLAFDWILWCMCLFWLLVDEGEKQNLILYFDLQCACLVVVVGNEGKVTLLAIIVSLGAR